MNITSLDSVVSAGKGVSNVELFAGPGEMRALMRVHDWSSSPLGFPRHWPATLRTVVALMLDSKFPMFVAWGPELSFLYNDAYAEILGVKHPVALGKRFESIWSEIWDVLIPLVQRALNGEATFCENLPLLMLRKGHEEQTWFTFSYSPVRDENGAVAGMYCVCTETTAQVHAERRRAFQLELTDRIRDISDPVEIVSTTSELLGRYLGADRVFYNEVDPSGETFQVRRDWTSGSLPSIAGMAARLSDFGDEAADMLRYGDTLVVGNTHAEPRLIPYIDAYARLGLRAFVAVPLVKQGRLVASLNVHRAAPHSWTADEVALIEDVSQRTWAAVEHANAEAALHAERDRSHRILESMAEGFLLLEPDFRIVHVNAEALRLEGRSAEDIVGKTFWEVWPGTEQSEVGLLYQKAMRERISVNAERHYLFPSGEDAWLEIRAYPAGDGLAVFYRDVTERKRAEEALRDSELQLRQLANTIPQLAWMADPDGWIHWYNDRWYEYTGTTYSQMEGWGWQSVVDPKMLPEVMSAWRASIATGEPFEVTFPMRSAGGEFRSFSTRAAPLRDAAGNIVQWFGTNTDVTALEEAEKAVRESEERLREGVVAARMAVWEWNLVTRKLRFSANSHEVLGFGSENRHAVGWDAIHPDDVGMLRALMAQAIAERRQCEAIIRVIRPDNGEILWLDVRGRLDTDSGEEPHYMRGIALDITERERAQQALREADRRKDEFLAMLAHELRNPLAPIRSAAQLLRLPDLDPARVRRMSEIIARQAQHMTALVNDLLDVSRVTRGLVEITKEPVELKEIIDLAVEQVKPLVVARQHQLVRHADDAAGRVLGDRTRLVQIVTNVLANAAKYTPDKGTIEVGTAIEANEVLIRVRDSGIGIGADLLPHVFELFTQAQRSPDRSQGGLGLGLALVRSLAELHGGSVKVHSEGSGKGSEFVIRLPLLAGTAADAVTDRVVTAPKADVGALHIVIVDDNVDAANTLAMLMEVAGHRTSVFYDGAATLEQVRFLAPDAIVLDIGLPDVDGLEVARRLRLMQWDRMPALIALTGYGQAQDRDRSMQAGFDHHLVKPVEGEQLGELLARLAVRDTAAGADAARPEAEDDE